MTLVDITEETFVAAGLGDVYRARAEGDGGRGGECSPGWNAGNPGLGGDVALKAHLAMPDATPARPLARSRQRTNCPECAADMPAWEAGRARVMCSLKCAGIRRRRSRDGSLTCAREGCDGVPDRGRNRYCSRECVFEVKRAAAAVRALSPRPRRAPGRKTAETAEVREARVARQRIERMLAAERAREKAALANPQPVKTCRNCQAALRADQGKYCSVACYQRWTKSEAAQRERAVQQRPAAVTRSRAVKTRPAPPADCPAGEAHRWRLDEPDGRSFVDAVCVKCGAASQQRAAWVGDADFMFGHDSAASARFPAMSLATDPEVRLNRLRD